MGGVPGRVDSGSTLSPAGTTTQRDGDVHEEDRLPADLVDEHTAEHRASDQPDARHRRPNPQRLRTLLGREHHGDQRQSRAAARTPPPRP